MHVEGKVTILYRSVKPVLTPVEQKERNGIIPNIVFPTAIDRLVDFGSPDCFDFYYGMADIYSRIRVGASVIKS